VTDPKGDKILGSAGFIVTKDRRALHIDPSSKKQSLVEESGHFNKLFWHEFDVTYRQFDHKELVIAHTTIYSSTELVLDRIQFSVLVIILSEIIEVVAMWFIFLLVSRQILGRPLAILTAATERLAHDDIVNFNVDIKSEGRHELKLLEEAFNSTATKLQAAKNELENRMRLALNAGRIATWIWYPTEDRLEFDQNLPSIFGQQPDGFGTSFEEINRFIHKDDIEVLVDTVSAAVSTRQSFNIDFQVTAADGQPLYLSIQAIVQGDDMNLPLRLVGTAMDITERKRMNVELETAKEVAEQASKAKGDFLATMSHEIRTPMNAVQGSVELLRRKDMPEEQRHLIGTISDATKNLLYILDDILDLAKIEDGKLSLEFIDFELSALLNQLIVVMSYNAKKKGLALKYSIADGVPDIIHGDPERVRQILWNLTSNAIKFTNQGEVNIQVQKIGFDNGESVLEFLIKDSGIGIPPGKIRMIFDPFVLVDSSTSRLQHGTGLGLAICKRLVDLMEGTITVDSTPGKGSVFRVVLSFKEVAVASERKSDRKTKPPLPLSLLLVEDEPVSQMIVAGLLADEGYEVDTASSGSEALEKVAQRSFDVILMDLRMPEMDGFETTMCIRSLPDKRVATTKIVAFTGDVMKETVRKCLDGGMDDIIAKPIDIIKINRILAALVARGHSL
jgi:signal transduction histidine kinase/CheY-like chemotaxis protein